MNNRKNFISALVLQIVTLLSGLILPRLIISTFGSNTNGLISSITQFLSFISLLEGGLGAVVLAELYVPLKEKNNQKVNEILYSCQRFFRKLAIVFIGYTIFLAIIYPLFIAKGYDFIYVSSLVIILSIATLSQFLFSITNKLLLQADQKVYIVNNITSITVLLNLIISVCIIGIFPNIHLVKLGAACIYIIQPFIYNHFVDKKYLLYKKNSKVLDNLVLKNRWSGFIQNLAHFVNMNTDVAVLTLFSSLTDVSVYSVYMLSINALRSIIVSVSNSYQSALGKYYAEANIEKLKKHFFKFEERVWILGIILFSTCLLLINPFVKLYTFGIGDANYYRPMFALIMVIANMIYCVREPYRLLILSAGKFKETNFGSAAEAIINILMSILLVFKFKLIGVAVGTLLAITYRMLYFIVYLKSDIIYVKYSKYIKLILTLIFTLGINIYVYFSHPFYITSFSFFVVYGFITIFLETLVTAIIYIIFDKLLKVYDNV